MACRKQKTFGPYTNNLGIYFSSPEAKKKIWALPAFWAKFKNVFLSRKSKMIPLRKPLRGVLAVPGLPGGPRIAFGSSVRRRKPSLRVFWSPHTNPHGHRKILGRDRRQCLFVHICYIEVHDACPGSCRKGGPHSTYETFRNFLNVS